MEKLRSLQALRAIAVLGVALFHANGSFFTIGAAGVDLFFVVSGYIITRISVGRQRSSFAWDRAWRIFPLYLVCSIVFLLFAGGQRSTCREIATWTLLPISCPPYLAIAWTLQFELLFYALATLCINRPKTLLTLIALLVMLGLIAPMGKVGSPMLLEFLAGALIARLPLSTEAGWSAIALAFVLYCFALSHPESEWERALRWGVPAACLVYGALSLERWFKPGWLVEVGNASYSIYLTHLMVLGHASKILSWPLALWAALIVGLGTHWLIERPLLRLKPHLPERLNLRGRGLSRSEAS